LTNNNNYANGLFSPTDEWPEYWELSDPPSSRRFRKAKRAVPSKGRPARQHKKEVKSSTKEVKPPAKEVKRVKPPAKEVRRSTWQQKTPSSSASIVSLTGPPSPTAASAAKTRTLPKAKCKTVAQLGDKIANPRRSMGICTCESTVAASCFGCSPCRKTPQRKCAYCQSVKGRSRTPAPFKGKKSKGGKKKGKRRQG